MKKLILLLLLFASPALCADLSECTQVAKMNPYIAGAGGAAALSCGASAYASGGGTGDNQGIKGADAATWAGLAQYVPAANISLCKVVFNVHNIQGDLTGYTYRVDVFTQAVGGNLSDYTSPVCTSSTLAGTSMSIGADITFTFTSCNLVTSQTNGYAIVLTHDQAAGTTNYLQVHESTASVISGTALASFGNTGTRTTNYTSDNPLISLFRLE